MGHTHKNPIEGTSIFSEKGAYHCGNTYSRSTTQTFPFPPDERKFDIAPIAQWSSDGTHGNTPEKQGMAQRPDPLRKELAFFLRRLIEQKRKLQDVNKRANRNDRSRETLESRMRMRKTQHRIDDIRAQMSKRASDSQDSNSSTSRSTSRGPVISRPPTDPPRPLPPQPAGFPTAHTTRE